MRGAPGGRREHDYRFAARSECILCHNPWVEARTTVFGRQSASPLALDAAQLDRDGDGQSAARRLERLGYFARPVPAGKVPRLTDPHDTSAGLDARARSYLQVNCAHCHQVSAGGSADIVLASSMPIEQTRTIDVRPIQGTFGIDDARIIAPGGAGAFGPLLPDRQDGGRADAPARLPARGRACLAPRRRLDRGDARTVARPVGGAGRRALTSLRDPATKPADRAEQRAGSRRRRPRALALGRSIERDGLPEPARGALVALARDAPRAEVRDLFERFVPDDERVKRLGDSFDPEAVFALTGDAGARASLVLSKSRRRPASRATASGGAGTDLGPVLDAIGAKYGSRDLLRQIRGASREIDPRYASHAVATRDGQVHVGLLVEMTDRALVLRDAQDRTIRIPTSNVEQHATRPASLMPEGLLRELTPQQAADLLEFLASLKGR